MDISKLNKTVEKYERECNAIAEKLEMAKQNLIDDPTDESRLKAIRNLESQLADWKSLLQASKQAVKQKQEADEKAKEKAIVDECARLKSEAEKGYDKAVELLVETAKAMGKVADLARQAEALNRWELDFAKHDNKYPELWAIHRQIVAWYENVMVTSKAFNKNKFGH